MLALIHRGVLLPVIAQIQPPRVHALNKSNFPTAAPTLELLLTRDGIVNVPKVLKPNEVQTIAFRKSFYISIPMLIQTQGNVVRHPNVQSRATLIGENVHPVVVVAHSSQTQIRDVSLRST